MNFSSIISFLTIYKPINHIFLVIEKRKFSIHKDSSTQLIVEFHNYNFKVNKLYGKHQYISAHELNAYLHIAGIVFYL